MKGDLRSQVILMAEGLITENRKNNAISKIGRVKTAEQKETLEKMLFEDVLETLQEKGAENGRKQAHWEKLSSKEKQEVKDHVKVKVRDFLNKRK